MPKTFDSIRVLLIQARDTLDMELQEQQCFIERCCIEPGQLVTANVVRDKISSRLIESVDVMMIGGAGEYSALDNFPWMDDLHSLICTARDLGFPTFGSCWGHQVIARACGGIVEHDLSRAEMGCKPIYLTEEGKKDLFFEGFPQSFNVNMGHRDRVVTLPPDGISLAHSDSQPNEAFRIKGKPIFGTQFHSELDAKTERERLYKYRHLYLEELPTEEDFMAAVNGLAETTEVDDLLHKFLLRFVIS